VFNQVADLALGIQEITELSCTYRADLNAGRISSGVAADSLDTEGAFLNNTLIAGPVAEIMGFGVNLLLCNLGISPVKAPGTIGAGRHAVTAADTPVVIYHNYAIGLFPGSLGGTDLDAGRIFTLLALYRHIKMTFFRYFFGIVILVRFLQVTNPFLSFLELKHAYIMDLGIA
jgi:hypothetical protein